jgi:hypothetical protein
MSGDTIIPFWKTVEIPNRGEADSFSISRGEDIRHRGPGPIGHATWMGKVKTLILTRLAPLKSDMCVNISNCSFL